VRVPATGVAEVTAWFNFLDMANERERAHPQVASRWQRILRAVDATGPSPSRPPSSPDSSSRSAANSRAERL
jgi:hypothetical protein